MKDRIQSWIWTFRRANRVDKAFLLAGLLLAVPPFLKDNVLGNADWLKSFPAVQAALQKGVNGIAPFSFALVALLLSYGTYKIWFRRPPTPEPLPPPPDAIKGGASFGPQDGDLFLRLGRNDELGKLCAWVRDPSIRVIAIKAESGAGKTSLVRSGLQHYLTQRIDLLKPPLKEPIACAYCEMRPSNPVADLLAAAGAHWPTLFPAGTKPPATLTELLDQAAAAPRPLVLILDQFEQLAAGDQRHAPIFDLLVRLLGRPGPSALTCVVAFRESYASDWMNFTVQCIDEAGLPRPREMILERFKLDDHPGRSAADVLATLADSARLDGSAVEKPLLQALADSKGRVLPFDLAIALQYLHSLGRRILEPSDIPPAGLDGIFANHLRATLGQFREAERSEVFGALFFGLVEDAEHGGRRVAEGRTAEELTVGRSLSPANLKYALNTLAERSVGVLERVPGERYRLVHERFIRALRELAGVMLADADRARVTFRRAYAAYERARPWRQLLRGSDLRDVERHWSRLRSDAEAEGSDFFYRQSILLRRWFRRGVAAASVLVLAAGIRGWRWAEDEAWRSRLADWGLPRNLYDLQWKLDRLTIENGKMDDAGWIKAPLKELVLHCPRLSSLPRSTSAKLDLWIGDLTSLAGLEKFPGLTTLDLNSHKLTSLAGLEKLPALTTLYLNHNKLTSLDGLEKLPALTTLGLSDNQLTSLAGVEKFPALTTLYLNDNELTSLAGLEKLPDLINLHVRRNKLPSLVGVGELPDLRTLDLSYNQLTSLVGLEKFPGLTYLDISDNQLASLAGLEKLPDLTTLDLRFHKLTSLGVVGELPRLAILDLSFSKLTSLAGLEKLPALTKLNLRFNRQLTSLEGLERLSGLTTLDINSNPLTSLAGLERLPRLTTLGLSSDQLALLTGLTKPPGLTTLDLRDNQFTSLVGLKKLSGLTTLDLRYNFLTSLAGIEKFPGLTTLYLSFNQLTNRRLRGDVQHEQCHGDGDRRANVELNEAAARRLLMGTKADEPMAGSGLPEGWVLSTALLSEPAVTGEHRVGAPHYL